MYSHKPHTSVNTTEDMAEVRVHAAFTVKDEGEFLKEAQKMIDATQVCDQIIFQNTFEKFHSSFTCTLYFVVVVVEFEAELGKKIMKEVLILILIFK